MQNLSKRRIARLARELVPTTRNVEGGSHARVGRSRRQCRLWKTRVGEKTSWLAKFFLKDNNVRNIMPKMNKILGVYLSMDGTVVGDDKIVWPSSFSTCCHDGGRVCCSAVLCGDHYCDLIAG